MGYIYFMKTKDKIGLKLEHLIQQVKQLKHTVKIIRCNNAGDNVRHIQDLAKKYGLTMEFTSPYTPQMNGVVERRLAVLKLRSQAILNQADLTPGLRNNLWTEAARCSNFLENNTLSGTSTETPFALFMGKNSPLCNHLREFGRIVYVTQRKKLKANWKNKALRGIMVG